MSDYTEHYNLKKPKQTESYNVEDANSNNDIIDKTLFKKQDKIPGKGLSTNDFTNEYKNKIDNLQKIYRFKGNVENYAGLSEISASNGDIYNVINEAKNYAWNGTEWVQLGFVIDMSEFAYKEEIPTKNSQLENDSNFASFPSGGYKGQILEKKSNNDNDVEWVYNDGGVTGDTLPIGSVIEFASDNIPDNWLLCNGQAVSRTDYAELFAAIGTTWGAGDGSTTFNVPTKEGLVTVGKKTSDSDFNALGKTGGEKEHTLTVDEMPAHNHGVSFSSGTGEYNTAARGDGNNQEMGYAFTSVSSTGEGKAHNNLQPYTTSNFIIKAKQSAGVVATVVDNLNSDSTTDALSAAQGKKLNVRTADTGWQTLTLTSDFHTYEDNSANTPQYRKTGKVVEIVGAIAPTSNISAGTNKTIATLPEGYRPSKNRYFICQGTIRAIWTLYVYSNGQVIFSRYGKSEYADASTDVWLPFNVTFLVD